MAKLKLKLTGEALEFFQKVGSKGGKTRARNYSAGQLSKWAKRGGRPPKKKKSQLKTITKPLPIPDGEKLLLPILKLLSDGLTHSSQEIRMRLRVQFKIRVNEHIQKLGNHKTEFNSNIDLALAYLQGGLHRRSKAIKMVRKGVYQIIEHGKAILRRNPSALTIRDL
jgi:Mrr restriction endonuclease-like protein